LDADRVEMMKKICMQCIAVRKIVATLASMLWDGWKV